MNAEIFMQRFWQHGRREGESWKFQGRTDTRIQSVHLFFIFF